MTIKKKIRIPNNCRFRVDKTENVNEVLLYADIGYFGIDAESFRNSVKDLDGKKKKLRVNSYGGEVFDGFAIYNAINDMKDEWEAEIDGVAASISSVIPLGA